MEKNSFNLSVSNVFVSSDLIPKSIKGKFVFNDIVAVENGEQVQVDDFSVGKIFHDILKSSAQEGKSNFELENFVENLENVLEKHPEILKEKKEKKILVEAEILGQLFSDVIDPTNIKLTPVDGDKLKLEIVSDEGNLSEQTTVSEGKTLENLPQEIKIKPNSAEQEFLITIEPLGIENGESQSVSKVAGQKQELLAEESTPVSSKSVAEEAAFDLGDKQAAITKTVKDKVVIAKSEKRKVVDDEKAFRKGAFDFNGKEGTSLSEEGSVNLRLVEEEIPFASESPEVKRSVGKNVSKISGQKKESFAEKSMPVSSKSVAEEATSDFAKRSLPTQNKFVENAEDVEKELFPNSEGKKTSVAKTFESKVFMRDAEETEKLKIVGGEKNVDKEPLKFEGKEGRPPIQKATSEKLHAKSGVEELEKLLSSKNEVIIESGKKSYVPVKEKTFEKGTKVFESVAEGNSKTVSRKQENVKTPQEEKIAIKNKGVKETFPKREETEILRGKGGKAAVLKESVAKRNIPQKTIYRINIAPIKEEMKFFFKDSKSRKIEEERSVLKKDFSNENVAFTKGTRQGTVAPAVRKSNSGKKNENREQNEHQEKILAKGERKVKNDFEQNLKNENFKINKQILPNIAEEKNFGAEGSKVSKHFAEVKQNPFLQEAANKFVKEVKLANTVTEISKFILKGEKQNAILKLHPQEFGEVKISIEVAKNVVNASIEVQNENVKHLIQNNIHILKENLAQNGLALNNFNINYSQKGKEEYKAQKRRVIIKNNSQDSEVEEVEKYHFKNLGYNRYDFIA